MNSSTRNKIISTIAEEIEIPESSYDLAEKRYKDLGSWFDRPESQCAGFAPHIHPQGSFRLGTVIRPLNDQDAYDLDLSCKLENGVIKTKHTQEQLKVLVGQEIENYRLGRNINKPKEEKQRCWRLEYADTLNFHMDIVPCIPERNSHRGTIKEAMIKNRFADEHLAEMVSQLTANITDNRHPYYRTPSEDWPISNPEGYAIWFEARMKLAKALLENRAIMAKVARVEDLPTFRWKTPLQQCVQVLKRHRDIMFLNNPDVKPPSVIITTLAARAYQGEADLGEAMARIVTDMEGLVSPNRPRVPNPVNPNEDFADKWHTPEGRAKRLEENFRFWLIQVKNDYSQVGSSSDEKLLGDKAIKCFGVRLNEGKIAAALGGTVVGASALPKFHSITVPPPRPWRK